MTKQISVFSSGAIRPTLCAKDIVDASNQIHLIRHGEPACRPKPRMSRDEFRQWVKLYDSQGILTEPPDNLQKCMYGAGNWTVFSSSLPRSVQSAKALVSSDQISSDALFDEAAIAIAAIPFRLESTTWVFLGRMLWLLGASSTEDFATCRLRARNAASLLIRSAISSNTVLVSHGWMNQMIGRELKKAGFAVDFQTKRGYWSHAKYSMKLVADSGKHC